MTSVGATGVGGRSRVVVDALQEELTAQRLAIQSQVLIPALKAIRLPQNVPLREGMERMSLERFAPLMGRIFTAPRRAWHIVWLSVHTQTMISV